MAEDSWEQGWLDLKEHDVNVKDVVIGHCSKRKTPYVIGALTSAAKWNSNRSIAVTGSTTGCAADCPMKYSGVRSLLPHTM